MEQQHVCPVWLGYTFITPLRKYQHNPQTILGPHIKRGMNILDYGCAMGYFSMYLARMTGTEGKVYCVDIQQKMLDHLMKRATNRDLEQIIVPLLVGEEYDPKELADQIDFALLFAVVHEVPDKIALFNDVYCMLKSGGKVLFAEPKGHVSFENFEESLDIARKAGFRVSLEKPALKGLAVFLVK